MTIVLNGEKYITKPCNVTSVDHLLISNRHVRDARHGPKSWLGLVTTESKFRQVRKDRCCWFTLRLIRIRIGAIRLEIKAGEVMETETLL